MGFVTEYGLRTGNGCSFLFLLQIDKGLYGEYFSMDIQAKREKEKEDQLMRNNFPQCYFLVLVMEMMFIVTTILSKK